MSINPSSQVTYLSAVSGELLWAQNQPEVWSTSPFNWIQISYCKVKFEQ